MQGQLLGVYHEVLRDKFSNLSYPLSYLSDAHSDVETWRQEAKAAVKNLLSYHPKEMPLNPQVHDSYVKDGLQYQHVSYAQPYGLRTEGILMRPEKSQGKLPGVLALHDHGGFKYYGKEKLTAPKNHPAIMQDYQKEYYGGRAWAAELAKRGYAVFVPDLFLWGSRKIQINDLPKWYLGYHGEEAIEGFKAPVDSDEYIHAYNKLSGWMESDIAKALIESGITWPGMMVYEDMRAMDFLASQPDVDSKNISCGGLSGGGLRTVFLAAMDERVKCSVCVGLMSTSEEFALHKVYTHTWMLYLPGLTNLMDYSDLYSLHGKKPTMVQFDIHDELFTTKGQEDAHARLEKIYEKMGAPELYSGMFFPGPHKFDVEMQEAAFDFYDKWMK